MKIKEYLKNTAKPNEKLGMLYIREFVECSDGFSISIQASEIHYCSPRANLTNGEYNTVELGFPNQEDELIYEYAQSDNYTGTIYSYVPIEIVEELINKHGGIKQNEEVVKDK